MDGFATMEVDIPLISIATIKVAVFLWYHQDINKIMHLNAETREQVMKNVKALPLPDVLQRRVLNIVQYVGYHLRSILISLKCMFIPLQSTQTRWPIELNFPKLLCWRNMGTVDKKKTVQKILNYRLLNTVDAFRLSCFNCVENEIFKSWCDSTARIERHFSYLLTHESKEVTFWLAYLRKSGRNLMRKSGFSPDEILRYKINEFGFSYAVANQNVVFADYHIKKMKVSGRKQLMLCAVEKLLDRHFRDFHSDIFQLAFSQLDREQKIAIFRKNSLFRLPHLLSWPLQDFFIDVVKEVYDRLFPLDFMAILSYIYLNISSKNYVDVLENILVKFWEESRLEHRSYVLSEWGVAKLLFIVFSTMRYQTRLGELSFADQFITSMVYNGRMFLEVLTGSCYFDSFENVAIKYMPREPQVVEFQKVIGYFRENHSCESFCHPNCFHAFICAFPDTLQLANFWMLCD